MISTGFGFLNREGSLQALTGVTQEGLRVEEKAMTGTHLHV